MTVVERWQEFLKRWEGRHDRVVTLKGDSGGPTKWGITLNHVWKPKYARIFGKTPDAAGLASMTWDEWARITRDIWTASGAPLALTEPVAAALADFSWHGGLSKKIREKALGIEKTDPVAAFDYLAQAREFHLTHNVTDPEYKETNRRGWQNRLNDLRKTFPPKPAAVPSPAAEPPHPTPSN